MKGCEYLRGKRAGWSKDNNRAPAGRRKAVRLAEGMGGCGPGRCRPLAEEQRLGRLGRRETQSVHYAAVPRSAAALYQVRDHVKSPSEQLRRESFREKSIRFRNFRKCRYSGAVSISASHLSGGTIFSKINLALSTSFASALASAAVSSAANPAATCRLITRCKAVSSSTS